MIGFAAIAGAWIAALTGSPAQAIPTQSVMIVEVIGDAESLGIDVPIDLAPDITPSETIWDVRVRIVRHVYGPTQVARMRVVADRPYTPGVRLLVIAEPRADGREGFSALYLVPESQGYMCVSQLVVDHRAVEAAFVDAVDVYEAGGRYRCVSAARN